MGEGWGGGSSLFHELRPPTSTPTPKASLRIPRIVQLMITPRVFSGLRADQKLACTPDTIEFSIRNRPGAWRASLSIAECLSLEPYSDARRRADLVQSLLIEKHGITKGGRVIDDWVILREDWSLVDELNRYVVNGIFNAEAAAAAIAEKLKPISDAWHHRIEAAFDKAEEESDRKMVEIMAQREAEKLKAKFLEELRNKRNQVADKSKC